MDAAIAEVVVGLIQVRRALDPATFRDLIGSIMVEIDQGLEVALERTCRRQRTDNVVPFPTVTAEMSVAGPGEREL
ncbi:hypothetical protein ACFQE0_17590 [Methylobacterium komagatae]|uniref:Uncharacterized protein n=1 Tax=Methylobacterium komagatae TaxID=374425 RepID=A0ABW2BLG0_9HYPH